MQAAAATVRDRVAGMFSGAEQGAPQMSAEMQETIFDSTINNRRSGTTGEEGAGMGLLIVKELVESNSGTITCRSDFSTGTDFIVAFPCIKT